MTDSLETAATATVDAENLDKLPYLDNDNATATTTEAETEDVTATDNGDKQFTQSELDKKLKSVKAQYKDFAAFKAKAEQFDKLNADQSNYAEQLSVVTSERDAAQLELTKIRVAASKGLPLDMSTRLSGTNEEELSADADALLALVRPNGSVSFGGGARQDTAASDNSGGANNWLRGVLSQ